MLEAQAIACVRGSRRLFARLSFRLEASQALRISGGNGTGKTSLLRIVAGLAPAEEGRVLWNGGAAQGEEFRRELAFIGHANALKEDLSAIENLRHALALAGIGTTRDAVRDELERQGLGAAMALPVKLLSQGQKRRAALARLAFCRGQALWILDEPFAALDGAAVGRLAQTLSAHLEGGGLLLFTTHQEVHLPGANVVSLELAAA